MRQTLTLLRSHSVVLVDMFAATFLFIFVAFLSLYTLFLLSVEQVDNQSAGGWKVISASPFDTRFMTEALVDHAENWADEAFVEVHRNRLVTYARTYRRPETFNLSQGADPESHLLDFMTTVKRNFERLGPTIMAERGYGNAIVPSINIYVFDSRHYYEVRDLIQERSFSWAEFAIPSDPSAEGENDGPPSGSIDASTYSQRWAKVLSTLQTVEDQRRTDSASSRVVPLQLVELDEQVITVRLLEAETEEEVVVDRLVPVLFLVLIIALAAEAVPYYRQSRARVRLKRALGVGNV